MPSSLRIDERIASDGGSLMTEIAQTPESFGASFQVVDAGVSLGELSLATLDAVMRRYAKPLDPSIAIEGPSIALCADRRVVMIRHRAIYDVIARDFLVLVRPDAEPVAALSTVIAGALAHLARAASEAQSRA